MHLYFDTTQSNYTTRLPTVREGNLIYVVCACPIGFENDEARNIPIISFLLITIAWAIVRDVTFKFHEKTTSGIFTTPTKGSESASDRGSIKKRSRMSSPSPAKRSRKNIFTSSMDPSEEEASKFEETSQSETLDAISRSNTPIPSITNKVFAISIYI
jgi:hypothetical protein